ncbi:3-isopropylmalate dehydratase large subunit [Sphingobium sp. EM0848]|uniref:3-isopropylmalate dehydratase large subunit n=1 Tax=Sphingobium sp. EM0848 TaxID=2743473 RepID=UPI00159C7AC2|nr:3-isopropylmalate dehydratase large subunit [Sphingobium sp. EM0848]
MSSLFEKIWRDHVIADLGDGVALIAIDRLMLHERTGGVALKAVTQAGRAVASPERVFAVMDHIVDTLPGRSDDTLMPTGKAFIIETRDAAKAAGITLFDLGDPRQGICHVVSPEQGIVLPGATLVCPDSHTGTQGAFGALAWGIGSSEAEHALITGTLRVRRPLTMRITVSGRLAAGVSAKDLALHLIARIGSDGAQGYAVEFAGQGIAALDIEQRQTLCNMATEMSAFSALIAPDEVTFAALTGRPLAPAGALWDQAVEAWRELVSDADARFDREIAVDAADVEPMISWGTSPQQAVPVTAVVPAYEEGRSRGTAANHARSLSYMGLEDGVALKGLPIDAVFIGSCTNSRLSDLRRAAKQVAGRKVAPGVRAICVPGSGAVKAAAEAEGIAATLIEAGFEWREPGCSMCFFAGGESFGLRERVLSTTNRNFESRQGPETRTHIASPELVAASAIAGCIADPREGAPA